VSEPRHFITGTELTRAELEELIERAAELKRNRHASQALAGRSVGMIFEKPSTRTRVSFEVGIAQLGGTPVVLRGGELQVSRGESPRDTAMVLSRYLDAIVARLAHHPPIEELAAHSSVPIVNALTPLHHPCQALADLLTLHERFGRLEGLRIAYVGDGNNVCHSLMLLGAAAGVTVAVATPPELRPDPAITAQAGAWVELTSEPAEAAAGAHALYTDVWVSMGDEDGAAERRRLLDRYRLDADLLARAHDDAVVLHCLPAHPGEEITEDLLYGPRSAVWDQAENRLHAQNALLELLLAPG
jgi:ornithine carbamoyltransferase